MANVRRSSGGVGRGVTRVEWRYGRVWVVTVVK